MTTASDEVCPINRCVRPLGIGTHMTLTGHGRDRQTIRVCEDHWQVLRAIYPLPPAADPSVEISDLGGSV